MLEYMEMEWINLIATNTSEQRIFSVYRANDKATTIIARTIEATGLNILVPWELPNLLTELCRWNFEKDHEVDARIQVYFTTEISTKSIKNTQSNLESNTQMTIEFHKK